MTDARAYGYVAWYREPTPQECDTNARVPLPSGRYGYAAWYPQMGGYVGKCIIESAGSEKEVAPDLFTGGCFDVYVWHDGEFPFGDGRPPVMLHHCDGEQFADFAEVVKKVQSLVDEEESRG